MYQVRVYVGDTFDYQSSWSFLPDPVEKLDAMTQEPAVSFYNLKLQTLFLIAGQYGKAIKLEMTKSGSLEAYDIYAGENVYGWFAAYELKVGDTVSRYIDKVFQDVGYYSFLQPVDSRPQLTAIAVSKTLEDLEKTLGNTFSQYSIVT